MLVETNTMTEGQFAITQGTMTIAEMGLSVPYSGKFDDLSLHPIKEIISNVLKNDAKKAFDIAAEAEFNKCLLRAVATTSSTALTVYENGTATGTNTIALSKDHIKIITDTMQERNIPPYMNDDYFCIAHPTTLRPFRTELETIKQYTEGGFGMIMSGEIGRYDGVRFIIQNNIAKGTWGQNKSNWAYFFGADTVAEGVAVREEMRGKIPGDYGRSRGVAWYYIGGFGLVHTAQGNAKESRILKWDSLA